MLPQIRQEESLYPIPQFSVEKIDIEGFTDELKGFHSVFADCFSRSEPRENFGKYMTGQFAQSERKSIEPIASHTEGCDPGCMRYMISDALWDEEKMLRQYHDLVNEDMGEPDGVVIFDESGFPRKGKDSAGVSGQYCGSSGKVENCQVGVFAAYASSKGYAFSDKRLSVPDVWSDDEHEEKRGRTKFPEDIIFKTKPQSAAEMSEGIMKENMIPVRFVAADPIYGESDDFLRAAEAYVGVTYSVQITSDTLCRLRQPATETGTYRYREEACSEKTVAEGEKSPVRVDISAKGIHDVFRYRRTVSEGSRGPIEYEFTGRQVTLCKSGLPDRTVWLVMKRTPDRKRYRFHISNAPVSTRLPTFVWLSGIRWAVGQCFGETKTGSGTDHYEVRKYPGRNHHMLTCMPAHFFLRHLRIRLGKKSSVHYSVSA
jgi:SRSO17 transposase